MPLPPDFVFSQNSLQDYVHCPRRFQLRYLMRLAWPTIEAEPIAEFERRRRMGSLFHRMIHQHILGIPLERLGRMASDPDLQLWWSNYAQALPAALPGKRFPEVTLSAPIGKWTLTAQYDLVVVSPEDKTTILDWKTADKLPKREWLAARLQTRIYRFLLARAGSVLNDGKAIGADQIEFVYWYAGFPDEAFRFAYDEAQATADEGKLTDLIQELAQQREDDYPLTEDVRWCSYCVYRSYCSRGDQAGRLEDFAEAPETEEEQLAELDFGQIAEIEF